VQCGEDLAVEQLISEAGVEAFVVAVFHGEPGMMNAVFAPATPICCTTS
jgi:hypothetical protein